MRFDAFYATLKAFKLFYEKALEKSKRCFGPKMQWLKAQMYANQQIFSFN